MDNFKEIIKEIAPFLKEKGFKKKGNTFFINLNKNYGIINLQKSQDSNKDEIKFTINFGVYSDLLGQIVDFDYDSSEVPDVWSCQWQVRIGDFMPNLPDFWWKVQVGDDLSEVISDIIYNMQKIILPEIGKRLTDEELMNSLVKGDFTESTAIETFKYLTIFLKAKGDIKDLDDVVEKFMQGPDGQKYYDIATEHLEDIDYNYIKK
ncbi:DUF4304 domain-containing protein [Chryseobacterium fluminis]|uniref:DUF4304 domain-containing protein n=1 Tax=Chryseobacterium fluminis TaxID=2983606 RepID=UPI00225A40DC|nr:DUF4304 domain-containing protein [Chryseobacterium sp. MMS21-Ot14]UZT99168.1 DUF4304 domain-containing protein [Chryseobacterium sp. MMS21-Ot14]